MVANGEVVDGAPYLPKFFITFENDIITLPFFPSFLIFFWSEVAKEIGKQSHLAQGPRIPAVRVWK